MYVSEERTRARALVVMLAYCIVRVLAQCWAKIDKAVEEGLRELAQLCAMEVDLPGGSVLREVPQPRADSAELLAAAEVQLPRLLPRPTDGVDTKRNLTSRRK